MRRRALLPPVSQADRSHAPARCPVVRGPRVGTVLDELVSLSVELPSGELRVLQPEEAAELPDDGAVEWAPVAPYWAVLWRSGTALARELDQEPLRGLSVVELGCGLGVPSLAAARA